MNTLNEARISRILTACREDRTLSKLGVRAAIESALREQDRDTRHACAEAVNALPTHCEGLCISQSAAESACMNVQAV